MNRNLTFALILLVIPVHGSESVIHSIRDLEIFAPVDHYSAALSESGNLYVLDKDECRVLIFDEDGRRIGQFGRQGEGPGEFNYPFYIRVDQHVVVYSPFSASVFDLDGNFQKRHKFKQGLSLPTVIGEKAIGYRYQMGADELVKVVSVDLQSLEESVLFEWRPERLLPLPERYMPDSNRFAYNPATEQHFFVVSKSNEFLFIGHMGPTFKISVHHLHSGKAKTITRDVDPLPFNTEWGQLDIEERNAQAPGSRKMVLADIDNFPIIKGMMSGVDDEIIVSLWTAEPEKTSRYLVFDTEGNDLELPYDPRHAQRLVGIHKEIAWLAAWNEDEGAYLVACPVDQIDSVAENHPWLANVGPKKTFVRLK